METSMICWWLASRLGSHVESNTRCINLNMKEAAVKKYKGRQSEPNRNHVLQRPRAVLRFGYSRWRFRCRGSSTPAKFTATSVTAASKRPPICRGACLHWMKGASAERLLAEVTARPGDAARGSFAQRSVYSDADWMTFQGYDRSEWVNITRKTSWVHSVDTLLHELVTTLHAYTFYIVLKITH